MRSKKFIFSILAFSFISFSATAQTATVQDFTRTNRLNGQPAVPAGVIPTQDVAAGTMCGSWNSNDGGPHTDCLGYNPGSSCPTGYFRGRGFAADGAWFLTCFKS